MSHPIEPCLEAEMLAETIRRSARDMNRDQLLATIDKLTALQQANEQREMGGHGSRSKLDD